jgi:hypothetical protein
VLSSAPPDAYFMPCAPCMQRQGFDAVEAAMKRHQAIARGTATEETDDFSILLPEKEREE